MSNSISNGTSAPVELPDVLARNLIDARAARGWTQATLARRAGVSRATIAILESGRGDPRVSTLHLLAKALNVESVEALLKSADVERSMVKAPVFASAVTSTSVSR